jgi:hypothetical protein
MPDLVEVTYLPEVECIVTIEHGLLDSQVVGVPDETGRYEYLRVPQGEVTRANGKTYLPIGIVELDRKQRRALVELPVEADSGFRRLWVPFDNFLQKKESP